MKVDILGKRFSVHTCEAQCNNLTNTILPISRQNARKPRSPANVVIIGGKFPTVNDMPIQSFVWQFQFGVNNVLVSVNYTSGSGINTALLKFAVLYED